MVTQIAEGTLLWQPSVEFRQQSTLSRYLQWLDRERHLHFNDYQELWQWSVEQLEDFWAAIWDFYGVKASKPYSVVLTERTMPGAKWFTNAELNYAEHIFAHATAERPALLFQSELQPLTAISWEELYKSVASIAATLRDMGVERGDRVVGYLPNIPQAAIAFLACASIGAIWSSCSPDFGTGSVVDRFAQIEPKVLFAVDGYQYNGKGIDRRPVLAELQHALPTVQWTVLVPYLYSGIDRWPQEAASTSGLARTLLWSDLPTSNTTLTFEQVPFDHPLWILYSSGTTGLPKAIVQGHGGILIEHLKKLTLHLDLGPADRFFWFTTTGWMMWNFLISGLLVGATVLLYDGSPTYPDMHTLWKFAAETGMTYFGTSAGYIVSCMKAGIEPGRTHHLNMLKSLGSTGSPLPPEGFQWVYERVKNDIWLGSVSGGTDVCTAFVGSCPLLPVYAGELQCRCLGASVQAFDERGKPLIEEVGELVITEPMPSMPLFFWNDPEGRRYRESYFEQYPGVWRHGDWIKITSRGTVVIYGRSDATINRMGVRMGSSEFYSVVEELPEVLDSLIVGIERPDGGYYLPLFVVLKDGVRLDDALKDKIKQSLRNRLTPRHVPDDIFAIPEVPRTLNGKKLEVPVKKILMGLPVEKAANPDGMSNPQSLHYFVEFARNWRQQEQ